MINALDDLARIRAEGGGAPPIDEPSNPIADQLSTPKYGDSRAQGVANVVGADEGDLVNFRTVKVAKSIIPRVEELAQRFPGLTFTSGHRTKAEQMRLNPNAPDSYHIHGTAVDLVGSSRDMTNALAWAKQNGAKEAMMHNVGHGFHLHLAW